MGTPDIRLDIDDIDIKPIASEDNNNEWDNASVQSDTATYINIDENDITIQDKQSPIVMALRTTQQR